MRRAAAKDCRQSAASAHKVRFQQQCEEKDGGGDDDDARARRHVAVVGEQESRNARKERDGDGEQMVALDVLRDIPCGGGGQHEQRVDDEKPDPLDADGDDDGEHGSKKPLREEGGDASTSSE